MIHVDWGKSIKKQHNFWNNIHFHPTDAIEDEWGQRILNEVAKDQVAQTVRMYAMLEDIVSMDESGNLLYDYSECDKRIDYMLSKGFNLLLSYNFIPKCIAIDPNEGTSNAKNKLRYKGKTIVASPPRDYALWEEICYQFTKHIVERYGLDTVSQWYLQCFNEPDIGAYFMKNENDPFIRVAEYLKLYRSFQSAIRRVSEQLKCGGPAMAHNPVFLVEFLKVVKAEGLKFDYFCGHTYGTSPEGLNTGARPFHVYNTLHKLDYYQRVLKWFFPEDFEVIIDEWGASTLGFWNREECPALMLREDSRFAAYFGKMITTYINANVNLSKLLICLSGQHEMVTDFSGFRGFFTLNFFKKPIYNAFVLGAKLKENILASKTDINGLAVLGTRDNDGKTSILLSYASENFDRNMPEIQDSVVINGLTGSRQVTIWCIDEAHTNPYTRMLRENMREEALSPEDIQILQDEGNMKPLAQYNIVANGKAEIDICITNNALMLIEVQ